MKTFFLHNVGADQIANNIGLRSQTKIIKLYIQTIHVFACDSNRMALTALSRSSKSYLSKSRINIDSIDKYTTPLLVKERATCLTGCVGWLNARENYGFLYAPLPPTSLLPVLVYLIAIRAVFVFIFYAYFTALPMLLHMDRFYL